MVHLYGNTVTLSNLGELARKLKIHVVTLRGYVRSGKLKARKIGRGYFVSKEAFEAFVNGPEEDTEGVQLPAAS